MSDEIENTTRQQGQQCAGCERWNPNRNERFGPPGCITLAIDWCKDFLAKVTP